MIRKTVEGREFESQMVGELHFDQTPKEGSFNPVTSDGVKNSIDDSVDAAKAEMQEKIDEVTLDPSAVALGNVHLLDEVTEFPADGCILVDSDTNGASKMSKDTLLSLTAQNALAGNVAPAFDPTRTSGNPYKAGESVTYEGITYIFKRPHYGAWVAGDAYRTDVEVITKKLNPSYFEIGGFDVENDVYTDINYRVRSRLGYQLKLSAGDSIVCVDTTNCYFWIQETINGVVSHKGPVTSHTAASDESVVLVLGYRNTDPIGDINDLLSRFIFAGSVTSERFVDNIATLQETSVRKIPSDYFLNGLTINSSNGNITGNSGCAILPAIKLKAGDFAYISSSGKHRMCMWKIYDDGSTPSGYANAKGFRYVEKDCLCVFGFIVDNGETLDVSEISDNFRIYTNADTFAKFLKTALVEDNQSLDASLFHYGTSGVYDGIYGPVYNSLLNLVQDPVGFIKVKKNDIVRIKDRAYKFRVTTSANNGAASQSSTSTLNYTIGNDCDIWLWVARNDLQRIGESEFEYAASCIEIISPYPQRNAAIQSSIENAKARIAKMSDEPTNIRLAAHRGETGLAPENTLPAFIAAKMNGYDTIETDVQFTSDGVPMILHDETVDRTSNGTGKLYELTYAQVRELDFGSWFDDRFAGTKIPTLEETLLLAKNLNLKIYLEFKPFGPYVFDAERVEQIMGLIEKYGMSDNVMCIGDPTIIHSVRPLAGIVLGANSIRNPNIVQMATAVKGDNRVEVWGQVDDTFDADIVSELQANGIAIGAWTAEAQNTIPVMNSVPKCVSVFVTNSVNVKSLFANMSLHGWV